MEINPDSIVYFEWRFVTINATLVFSWMVMGVLTLGAWIVTRTLTSGLNPSHGQTLLEVVVRQILDPIEAASLQNPRRYLPFIGTLFLFIVASSLLDVVPGFRAPTASLSTPAALALCVFVAVPVFGVANRGTGAYVRHYLRPTPLMLPFNLIGELSRTVALAVRLFGNMLSGQLIVAILLSLAPLFFPVLLQAFGLLVGVIQAYVFAILALVYIASGARQQVPAPDTSEPPSTSSSTKSTAHNGRD